MKQGIQSTLKNKVLAESGCYFLCLLRWAEIVGKREFNEDNIDFIFDMTRRLEYVRKDCLILIPNEVINLALQQYRFSRIIAPFPTSQPDSSVHPIQIAYLEKPKFSHFILLNAGETWETWDPLDPKRPGVADYRPVSYRIIV